MTDPDQGVAIGRAIAILIVIAIAAITAVKALRSPPQE